jgi:hypothetical protein
VNLEQRYQNLLRRRAPTEDRQVRAFAEGFEREQELSIRLLVGSLAPVDPRYTAMLVEQGDRVEEQLRRRIPEDHVGVVYRRQGSVSNNTHIRFSSDVDVLAIIGDFVTLEPPQVASSPYQGEPDNDLLRLRRSCVRHLGDAYPAATVDDSGATAVWLKGGSLRCDIDVVPANWYDTMSFASSGLEKDRGVMVFNRDRAERIKNYPFLFNYRIGQRDIEMGGLLRAQIRLLKTIASDLKIAREGEPLSSFDICSVVYRMNPADLQPVRTFPIRVATSLVLWLRALEGNPALRATLKVVDDSRLIFDKDEKVAGLVALRRGLEELVGALPAGLGALLYESRAYL